MMAFQRPVVWEKIHKLGNFFCWGPARWNNWSPGNPILMDLGLNVKLGGPWFLLPKVIENFFINYVFVRHVFQHRCYLFGKSFRRIFVQPSKKIFVFKVTLYLHKVIPSRHHYCRRTFAGWFNTDVGSGPQRKKGLPFLAGKGRLFRHAGNGRQWKEGSLDTQVMVDNEGCLTTDLYAKPTDTHQYLHRDSCNPSHCKRGIPYSQVLRIQRICSETEDYLLRTQELKGFLINRGYNEDEIQHQIDRTTGLDRKRLLRSKRVKTPLERVPLIVTYHPGLPPHRNIVDKHLSILNVSKKLKQLAVRNPPLVAYRRPPNLRTSLVRAQFVQKEQLSYKGNSRCQQTRCKTCRHIQPIKMFKSSVTGKTYTNKSYR